METKHKVTLKPDSTRLNKNVISKSIKGSYGNVTAIARKLHCERKTVYEWLEREPELKSQLDFEREELIDFAEIKLIERLKAGSESMISLILKTLGKNRGYYEAMPKSLDEDKIRELKKIFDAI
jgi:hypothetical protein